MDNQNPATMSNEDLEKEAEKNRKASQGQENVQKTTAAEGNLISPEDDKWSKSAIEDSHDGSMPDPESVEEWENKDRGDKMAG